MSANHQSGLCAIEFVLNGQRVQADADLHTTLLDFLRSRSLTGAKEGCAEGECGACAVVMVRQNGTGSAYSPVNSCLMLLPMAAGHEIYTVEALAQDGKLAAVQQAIADHGGSQCGYCTPGFVMSLFAEHYRPGRTGACDPHATGGNLCRCTGYRPIRDAALSLGPAPQDAFSKRLLEPAPKLTRVDCEFGETAFHRPATLDDCLELLTKYPDARLIAGATDLAVESNLRGRRFSRLISVESLLELREFRETKNEVVLGCALTLSEIQSHWTGAPKVMSEWLELFASPLIRNRATLGGNIATASPIGDAPPLLLALDAQLQIAGPQEPLPQHVRFFKVAKRKMDDISTIAAGFAINLDSADRVARARLAFGGVAAVPLRATEAEQALPGHAFDESAIQRAQQILERTLQPISDHRGSAAYRTALAQSLLEKFWFELHEEAVA